MEAAICLQPCQNGSLCSTCEAVGAATFSAHRVVGVVAIRYAAVVPKLAVLTPDGIAFLVTEDEGVGTLQDFAGEHEVSLALPDF